MLIRKKYALISCVISFFLFFTLNIFAAQTKLIGARISGDTEKSRLVLLLDSVPQYHVFTLQNPNRVVIDLENTALRTDLKDIRPKQSLITDIRDAKHNDITLRIVLDMKANVTPKNFLIKGNAQSQPRLVIDLASIGNHETSLAKDSSIISQADVANIYNQEIAKTKITKTNNAANNTDTKTTNTAKPSNAVKNTAPIQTTSTDDHEAGLVASTLTGDSYPVGEGPLFSKQTKTVVKGKSRNIIVVIDPGHGGKDPGATGPHGIHEKNVVLAISKALQNDLNKIPGVTAELTRNSDYFVTLRDRLTIARQDKADLFIAVHADAAPRRGGYQEAEGATVWALSERGATSESARWLAQQENHSELGGVEDFSDKSRLIRSVLLDLSQTVTISQSLQIGNVIMNSLKSVTPLHHNRVEQAGFVVLKSPDIPSLLIETGFITSPLEEARLNSSKYQNKLADAITYGVEQYFWQHPPPGTYFAARQNVRTYQVAQGDTVQSIAEMYGVDAKTIMKLNHINSVQAGQKIKVPVNNNA